MTLYLFVLKKKKNLWMLKLITSITMQNYWEYLMTPFLLRKTWNAFLGDKNKFKIVGYFCYDCLKYLQISRKMVTYILSEYFFYFKSVHYCYGIFFLTFNNANVLPMTCISFIVVSKNKLIEKFLKLKTDVFAFDIFYKCLLQK